MSYNFYPPIRLKAPDLIDFNIINNQFIIVIKFVNIITEIITNILVQITLVLIGISPLF